MAPKCQKRNISTEWRVSFTVRKDKPEPPPAVNVLSDSLLLHRADSSCDRVECNENCAGNYVVQVQRRSVEWQSGASSFAANMQRRRRRQAVRRQTGPSRRRTTVTTCRAVWRSWDAGRSSSMCRSAPCFLPTSNAAGRPPTTMRRERRRVFKVLEWRHHRSAMAETSRRTLSAQNVRRTSRRASSQPRCTVDSALIMHVTASPFDSGVTRWPNKTYDRWDADYDPKWATNQSVGNV